MKGFIKIIETQGQALSSFGDMGPYLARNMRISGVLAIESLDWNPSRPLLIEELRAGSYQYAAAL